MSVAKALARLFGGPGKRFKAQPFGAEVVLRDGTSHFVYSVAHYDEQEDIMILRIWDLRPFSDADLTSLRSRLNRVFDQETLAHPERIDPRLDWAILYVNPADILYSIEWFPRLWPEEVKQREIGFRPPAEGQ